MAAIVVKDYLSYVDFHESRDRHVCLRLGTNFYRNRFLNGRDTAFVGLQDGDGGSRVTPIKYLRFRVLWVRHVLFFLSTNFSQNRLINGRDTAFVAFRRWRRRWSRDFGQILPVSGFSCSACDFASGYKFSSKSVHKWPRYRVCRFYKMAAAVITWLRSDTSGLQFFEIGMCFCVWVPIFIEIGSYLLVLQAEKPLLGGSIPYFREF